LSKPITLWSIFNKNSRRFDPMKPETPVINQMRGSCLRRSLIFENLVITSGPRRLKPNINLVFIKKILQIIDNMLFFAERSDFFNS